MQVLQGSPPLPCTALSLHPTQQIRPHLSKKQYPTPPLRTHKKKKATPAIASSKNGTSRHHTAADKENVSKFLTVKQAAAQEKKPSLHRAA